MAEDGDYAEIIDLQAAAAIDDLAWLFCDGRPNPSLLQILAWHRDAARPLIERAARKEALEAVEGERLEEPQAGTSDEAYERALDDAVRAIRALDEGGGK